MGFEGSPSKINLRPGQHADKTWSTWWCLMDERKSVEGTNAARDKPMVSDSSTQLEHAAWQDGARTLIGIARACRVARWRRRRPFVGTAHAPASARPAPVRSTAQELKIRCVPAGFSQGPVCESRPGLYTRPGQIWVLGSAGGLTG